MGDRLATIDMGRGLRTSINRDSGGAVPLSVYVFVTLVGPIFLAKCLNGFSLVSFVVTYLSGRLLYIGVGR